MPWAVVMAGFAYFTSTNSFYPPFAPNGLHRGIAWLIFILPFGIVAGAFWGRSMWRTFEKKNWFLPPESDTSGPAV